MNKVLDSFIYVKPFKFTQRKNLPRYQGIQYNPIARTTGQRSLDVFRPCSIAEEGI